MRKTFSDWRAVVRPHVDSTLEAEQRAGGRTGNPMLAGARFRDDAALAHA